MYGLAVMLSISTPTTLSLINKKICRGLLWKDPYGLPPRTMVGFRGLYRSDAGLALTTGGGRRRTKFLSPCKVAVLPLLHTGIFDQNSFHSTTPGPWLLQI